MRFSRCLRNGNNIFLFCFFFFFFCQYSILKIILCFDFFYIDDRINNYRSTPEILVHYSLFWKQLLKITSLTSKDTIRFKFCFLKFLVIMVFFPFSFRLAIILEGPDFVKVMIFLTKGWSSGSNSCTINLWHLCDISLSCHKCFSWFDLKYKFPHSLQCSQLQLSLSWVCSRTI